ncbi:MAG: divalent-cation tolerance protein CutA [Spirochaetia bacterium]
MSAPGFLQVVTTVASKEQAGSLAQRLVELHLAGCVQVSGPITSTYWWKGKMEKSEEWCCIIKTSAARYDEVEREVRSLHTYEKPEIIAFPIVSGSATYLEWLGDSLGTEREGRGTNDRGER